MSRKDDDYAERHSDFDRAVSRANRLAKHYGQRQKVTVLSGSAAPYQVAKSDRDKK